MKAQNLSVCVPYQGCDKNCPYCVSVITGYSGSNRSMMRQNLTKVRNLADSANVSSVLLTGKGEPCLNLDDVVWLLDAFAEFPTELQTNGLRLTTLFSRDPGSGDLERLRRHGLNVLAISFDRLEQFAKMQGLIAHARDVGLVVRVTFNLTDRLDAGISFGHLISECKRTGIHQFSLRQVTIPNEVPLERKEAVEAADWIRQHVDPGMYDRLVAELLGSTPRVIRRLPYGAVVYDFDGVSVSYFDYCIQDDHGDADIRSLILNDDGHLYTAWNSPASILF